ncbi:MAG: hypothetical protein WC462_03075 [archaeon]
MPMPKLFKRKRLMKAAGNRFAEVNKVLGARKEKQAALRGIKLFKLKSIADAIKKIKEADFKERYALDDLGRSIRDFALTNPNFRKALRSHKYTYVSKEGDLVLTNLPRLEIAENRRIGRTRFINSAILDSVKDIKYYRMRSRQK